MSGVRKNAASYELRAASDLFARGSKLVARGLLSCEVAFYLRGRSRRNEEKSVIPVGDDLVYKMVLVPELKVLLSRDQIAKRVAEIAEEITRDFKGQSVIFVGVLKGAAIFLSDLARQVRLDATFDFIGVSSYGNRPIAADDPAGHAAWDSLGEVRVTKDLDQSMTDRNVILVEDILDTGLTLNYIQKLLLAHQPRTLRIAALLDKPSRRKQPIQAHYIGFAIPDAYVVGYGLDYAERYRNLPDICVIENP